MTGTIEPIQRRLRRCALLAAIIAAVMAVQPSAAQTASIPVANGGFEVGNGGAPPPHWFGTTGARPGGGAPAYRAVLDAADPHEGKTSVRLERTDAELRPGDFGVLTSRIDARAYRGRRLRLTGAVRTDIEAGAQVGLWMRVDRERRLPGFFDNMRDRPINSPGWADFVVEGDVADDAETVFFGLILAGAGRVWMDNVRLEDVGPVRHAAASAIALGPPRPAPGPGDAPPRALSDRGLVNLHAFARLYGLIRFFHPSDEAAAADWDSIALAGIALAEGAQGPAELAEALDAAFQPVAPAFRAYLTSATPPAGDLVRRPAAAIAAVRWRHVGMGNELNHLYASTRVPVAAVAGDDVLLVSLPGGVGARIPLVVWRDADGSTLPRPTAPLPATGKPAGFVPAGFDRTTRLAAAMIAWNLFRHFYPYPDLVELDWDGELHRALRSAATDPDDRTFHATLRRLVAALQDGHGGVFYPAEAQALLPIAWDWIEGRLVVTNVDEGVEGIARGDVVTHVGGKPAEAALVERMALNSGSLQWTRVRGLLDLLTGPLGETVELRLQGTDGRLRTSRLSYDVADPASRVPEVRPEPIAELAPGILYVNLDGMTEQQYRARDGDLARARGLIFDLRGYPRMPPIFLPRLIDRPVQSAHMDRPVFLRPDHEGVSYEPGGWNIQPEPPRYTSNVAFIADGSAISYAESILGVVAGNGLAPIVGEPSAGANGNVASFDLPGGYRVGWTGMRVHNRDGSPHHVVGVRPTVAVSRTLAGVRAGRDEQLERALAIVMDRAEGGVGAD